MKFLFNIVPLNIPLMDRVPAPSSVLPTDVSPADELAAELAADTLSGELDIVDAEVAASELERGDAVAVRAAPKSSGSNVRIEAPSGRASSSLFVNDKLSA